MVKKKREKKVREGWRMTSNERFRYYLGDTGRLFGSRIITNFMSIFLLFQGINLASLAGIILVVKIIDAADDVIFGFFVDKLKITEWKAFKKITGEGKYLPWYRLTFFLFPLATILFFCMPNSLSDGAKITWFAVTYLLYDLTCTLSEVPLNSMVMTLTDNVDERNNMLKVKGVITTIAAIALGVIWTFLISESVGLSVRSVAIGSALICLLMMLPLLTGVKEHNTELKNVEADVEEKYTFKDMLNCIKTNKYMALLLASNVVYYTLYTVNAVSTLIAFYCFNNTMVSTIPMLVAFIPGIIIDMNADKIAKKIGRRNSLVLMGFLSAALYLVLYLIGRSSTAVYIAICSVACIPGAVKFIFLNLVVPDTIEYARYKTGKDCSGIFFSLNSFVNKATDGIASSLAVLLLGIFGWVEVNAESFADLAAQGVTQSAAAINGMWAIGSLIPAIGMILCSVILLFYDLKDKDAELMARCNSGEITREECEAQLSKKY